jgi:carboxypeptidase C (cathepsin A)
VYQRKFQEHGPCRITNDTTSVKLNPYSWNNGANMLYIDQPVGVGWSYGKATVGTSEEAAVDVWKFMQIFLKDSRFQKYANRSLGIFGESYGGHYGLFYLLCFFFSFFLAALRTECWIFYLPR